MKKDTGNHLIHEKSPYLRQHAHNPVNWYPWGRKAFEASREADKPIFLSIGYSTCHWCHVMEAESFEDPEVAALMNEAFISIKVDREERPDIDRLYIQACQLMTGQAGWPLTVVMTPEQKPFFAGTYIPKHDRFGRVGMMRLIPRIQELWENKRQDLIRSSDTIIAQLEPKSPDTKAAPLRPDSGHAGFAELKRSFDPEYGGFGREPKFPIPHHHSFLLRYWRRTGRKEAKEMVEVTLRKMYRGGIFDQVGFGFHRYSTDRRWFLPHFEKMLYDQALLSLVYTEAFQATGGVEYRDTAQKICTYVLRDMVSDEGAFYSAEDADSLGGEGRFYTWSWDEVERVLSPEEISTAARFYRLRREGNFSPEAGDPASGLNILSTAPPQPSSLNADSRKEAAFIESIRKKLFHSRQDRSRPLRDDKVLADWNGLMIAALAGAARSFEKPDYADAAVRSARFILSQMRQPDGGLWHRFHSGESAIKAYADDYAFLIWGLIELYETTFAAEYLRSALELNKYFSDHFWDPKSGGYFFTPDNGEALFWRHKEIIDGAIPSSNSVALLNLVRLSRLTASPGLEAQAAQLANVWREKAAATPSSHSQFLCALDFLDGPSIEIVITGRSAAPDTLEHLRILRAGYYPSAVVIFIPTDTDNPEILKLAPFTRQFTRDRKNARAYVCRGFQCHEPTSDPQTLRKLLEEGSKKTFS